jgi:hypothetical protein
MRKSIELGDSGIVAGVATLLWVFAFAALVFFLRGRFPAAVILLLGYGTVLPLGFLRRRFGRRLLIVRDRDLHWLPHGRFGPSRKIPIAGVRSVSEWRLGEDRDSTLPIWSLVLHMVDGTELRLGQFSTPSIHEIVEDLNRAINSQTGGIAAT